MKTSINDPRYLAAFEDTVAAVDAHIRKNGYGCWSDTEEMVVKAFAKHGFVAAMEYMCELATPVEDPDELMRFMETVEDRKYTHEADAGIYNLLAQFHSLIIDDVMAEMKRRRIWTVGMIDWPLAQQMAFIAAAGSAD